MKSGLPSVWACTKAANVDGKPWCGNSSARNCSMSSRVSNSSGTSRHSPRDWRSSFSAPNGCFASCNSDGRYVATISIWAVATWFAT